MWKRFKFKYEILSFLLIVGIVLTGIRFSDGVHAESADRTELIVSNGGFAQKTVQHGNVLEEGADIDLKAPLSVTVDFKVPVLGDLRKNNLEEKPELYIAKGDKARYVLGKGIKLKKDQDPTVVDDIKDKEGYKVGTATFIKEGENVVMDFAFNGDDAIYDGTRHDVNVKVTAEFEIDTTSVDPEPGKTKQITVLGKTYNIGKVADEVIVRKTGVVNYNDKGCNIYGCGADEYPKAPDNMSVTWTVEIERKGIGGQGLSLAGYTFRDDLSNVGDYQVRTFKVDGVQLEDDQITYDKTTKMLSYKFPQTTNSTAKIEFNTRLTMPEFKGGTTKNNTANILNDRNEHVGSAEGTVTWDPNWGRKYAKEHKRKDSNGNEIGESFRKDNNGNYFIDWEIEFNKKGLTLNNVRIYDPLREDTKKEMGVKFEKAVLKKYAPGQGTADDPDWKEMKTFDTYPTEIEPTHPQYKGSTVFNVGDISFPIKLTMTVKVDTNAPLTTPRKFPNYAVVLWGSDWLADFYHEAKVGEGSLITKNTALNYGCIPLDQVWNISVPQNDFTDPDKTFVYDAMIFDPHADIYADLIIKDEGGHTELQSGIPVKKVIHKHKRFNKYLGEFNSVSPTNLQHRVYKIYQEVGKGSGNYKYIGDVLEVWNLDKNQKNRFNFKSRITAPELIMGKQAANYNIAYLIHNGEEKDNAYYWPTYRGRMLEKQALTATTSKKIIADKDYSPAVINENVYNSLATPEEKAVNNKETAYYKDDKSVIYRLSVNAAGVNGIDEYTGVTVLEDNLPEGWEFAPIKDSENYLVYEGKAYGDVYSLDAVVEALNGPVDASGSIEAAVSGRSAKFTFKKLDKPYVILLKAKMSDPAKFANKKEVLPNKAVLSMDGYKAESSQDVDYDESFLSKEYDATNIKNGYLKWTIEYKPYKSSNNDPVYMEDMLGEGLEIRRNKADGSLSFNNGNYRMIEADENGSFEEGKGKEIPVEELQKLLKYDPTPNAEKERKLTIKIPDKKKSYRFIYITDIDGKGANQRVKNIVKLFEGGSTTHVESPKDYIIDKAFGSATSKGFVGFTIVKTDDGTKIVNLLKGAKFKVTYPNNSTKTFTTNEEGKAVVENLVGGATYKLEEIEAPKGYERDTKVYTIKIKELTVGYEVEIDKEANDPIDIEGNIITVKNKKVTVPQMELTLVKTDEEDKPLKDAEFELEYPSGEQRTFTTDTDGKIKFEGLKVGNYKLRETKAPDGYQRDLNIYELKIEKEGSTLKAKFDNKGNNLVSKDGNVITVKNKEIGKTVDIELFKIDKADEHLLAGAEFRLTRKKEKPSDDTYIAQGVTDKEGQIIFKGLVKGTYILEEIKAPSGYNIGSVTKFEIKVDPKKTPVVELVETEANKGKIGMLDEAIVVTNEKKPTPPPITPPGPGPNPPGPGPSPDPGPTPPPNTPDLPIYPPNNPPDPNEPGSPDEFVVVDEDGTPQGRYIKKTKPNGEKEYVIDEDGTPKGNVNLPKTGEANNVVYYAGGAILLIFAAGLVIRRKRYDAE